MNRNFPFVDAQYRDVADPRYSDNPFIRALPALPSKVELTRALAVLPKFDPQERTWPDQERIQRLDIVGSLVIPLPRHVYLASAMHKLMITGYGPRKPFSQKQNKIAAAVYKLQQAGTFQSLHDAPLAPQLSLALFGIPGAGKSYMIWHIAGMLPRAIFHPELGKWQIPYLIVEMPHDGESCHTLATSIFEALDKLIPDGNFVELYRERKGQNAEERLKKALAIAFDLGVGMLVIDEAQNHSSASEIPAEAKSKRRAKPAAKKETKLVKLLITASNVSHIPLLLVGTLELKQIQMGRMSRARRMAGRGSAQWKELHSSGSLEAPGDFEFLMMGLFKYQWIRQPIKLEPIWIALFFDVTQGIVDIAVKLWESCQVKAINNRSETISEALVREVFDEEFVATEYGIKAKRTKDKLLMQSFVDLFDSDDFGVSDAHTPLHPDSPAQGIEPKQRAPKRELPKAPSPVPMSPTPEMVAACTFQASQGTAQSISVADLYGASSS